MIRIELMTSSLPRTRSTKLSYMGVGQTVSILIPVNDKNPSPRSRLTNEPWG